MKVHMPREDAHLDKPGIGDKVEFSFWDELHGHVHGVIGEVVKVYTRTADIKRVDGSLHRGIAFKDTFVLSKAD